MVNIVYERRGIINRYRLENWRLHISSNNYYHLAGIAFSHPQISDGVDIRTSRVIKCYQEDSKVIVETENSIYELELGRLNTFQGIIKITEELIIDNLLHDIVSAQNHLSEILGNTFSMSELEKIRLTQLSNIEHQVVSEKILRLQRYIEVLKEHNCDAYFEMYSIIPIWGLITPGFSGGVIEHKGDYYLYDTASVHVGTFDDTYHLQATKLKYALSYFVRNGGFEIYKYKDNYKGTIIKHIGLSDFKISQMCNVEILNNENISFIKPLDIINT